MKNNKYILDSHLRCGHLLADKIQPVVKTLRLEDIEKELVKVTGNCLSQTKTTFFALYNSFFTLTNKELIVLNCFVNKNSNIDMKRYIPLVGTILQENLFGTNAISISCLKGNVAYVVKNEHYRKLSKKLSCVAAPINLGDEILGYIGFSTINKWEVNSLRVLIEDFSQNISDAIVKVRLKNKLSEFLMHLGKDLNHRWVIPYISDKEKLIIEYIMKAYTYEIIAKELSISEKTVLTYLKRIFNKCGTKNRVDTAIFMLCSEILGETKL